MASLVCWVVTKECITSVSRAVVSVSTLRPMLSVSGSTVVV